MLLLSAPIVLKTQPVPQTERLPLQAGLTQLAQNVRTKHSVPGVWAVIMRNGQVVAKVAVGYRNVESRSEASLDDHVSVGSVSKLIAAALIASQVAAGKVTYDLTLREALPDLAREFPQSPALNATLGQLLSHTAGFPRIVANTMTGSSGPAYRRQAVRNSMGSLAKEFVEPGSRELYSNLGYIAAVAMVEARTGTRYDDWLTDEIGRSWGLRTPSLLDWQRQPSATEVSPHFLRLDQVTLGNLTSPANYRNNSKWGVQGSLQLTLDDLFGFMRATVLNSPGLPSGVYSGLVSFPPPAPAKHTLGGWEYPSDLVFVGNTGRAEWCQVRVNTKTRNGFACYVNLNTPTPTDFEPIASDLISGMIRLMRS